MVKSPEGQHLSLGSDILPRLMLSISPREIKMESLTLCSQNMLDFVVLVPIKAYGAV